MFEFPKEMKRVFIDEHLQRRFEIDGFIIVPFYSDAEVNELVSLYYELHPSLETGFFPSTFSNDKNYRKKADEEIQRICKRPMSELLVDIQTLFGAFIVKNPGPESGMCVHQDMTLVDESEFTGINIWVPLTDLNVKNGALFVLPGSHRLFPTYRGSSIPEFFREVNDVILDYMVPIEVQAGTAVFFDQSIIHYSPPNYSDKPRIVTNTYFTHKNARFQTCFWNKELDPNGIEIFEQNQSFMTDFDQFGQNIHKRPAIGNSKGIMPYNFPLIDESFLKQHFTTTGARSKLVNSQMSVSNSSLKTVKKKTILHRIIENFT